MDRNFVFVTVEEVELSLSSVVTSVVTLGDKEEEDDALEARVRATQEVANVHELALLQRASLARALSRQLSQSSDLDEEKMVEASDVERRCTLENTLREAWFRSHPESTDHLDAIKKCDSAEGFIKYLRDQGRGVKLTGCERRLRTREVTARDLSEAQARKDIERDNLVIVGNEATTKHAAAKYDNVVASIADAQKTLVRRADATEWRPVDDADLRSLAKAALIAVNRTESGGLALEALADLLPPGVTPVPDSKQADPLRIHLSLGPAEDPSKESKYSWRWGLRATVEGVTFYRLFPSDDFDNPIAIAKATYSNFLILPLDALDTKRRSSGSCSPGGGGPTVLYDRDAADVSISISLTNDEEL